MHYALVGRISMEVPAEFESLVAEAFLRFYDGTRAANDNNGKFDPGSLDQTLPLKGLQYLAREPLEVDGGYTIGIDDRQCSYTGGSLLAVLELPFVKSIHTGKAASPNLCLVLDWLRPDWAVEEKSARFQWNHHIHAADWIHAKPCAQMGCNDVS